MRAVELWERLQTCRAEDRREVVRVAREFQSWALVELVCAESVRAAAGNIDRAGELADLAVKIAELVPGSESQRAGVQGYAWAHVANVRRVAGELVRADRVLASAKRLWKAGEAGFLDPGRLLDLEASLRRDQRRFPEALALHDQAATCSQARGRILLNKAFTLEQMGQYGQSIETLRKAAPLVEHEGGPPRLRLALRFTLTANLCRLERHQEAWELLPQVRELATEVLDLVRLRWLEGRVAAGLGDRAGALATLNEVRRAFLNHAKAYDIALVSLELAALLLEDGQTKQVQEIARELAPVFFAQGVHREVLAALKLFRDAAEQEAVTLDLTRRLVDYLHRARHDKELRFAA